MKTTNIDRVLTRAQGRLNEVEQAIAVIRAEINRLDELPEFQMMKDGMLVKGLSFAVKELEKRRRVLSNRIHRLAGDSERQHDVGGEINN